MNRETPSLLKAPESSTLDLVRDRLGRVRASMERDRIDVLVAYKVGGEAYAYGGQGYFRYLVPSIEPLPIPPAMAVMTASGRAVTAVLYRGLAATETWASPVLDIESCEMTGMQRLRSQELIDGVSRVIARNAGGRTPLIGIALLEELPRWLIEGLRNALPEAQFVDGTDLLDELVMIKTPEEIEMVRRVASLAEDAIDVVFGGVAPGRTELEVIAEAKKLATIAGADYADVRLATSNPKRSGFGVGPSSRKVIEDGDHLHIGVDISCDGYWANVVRRGVLGEPSGDYRKLHEVTRAMHATFLEEAHVGRPAGEVVKTIEERAHDALAGMGVREFEYQRLGHGIGFENQEPPFLVRDESRPIVANMTFAVHPGLLARGIGQAALGSIVLVSEDGARSLTSFSEELVEV